MRQYNSLVPTIPVDTGVLVGTAAPVGVDSGGVPVVAGVTILHST